MNIEFYKLSHNLSEFGQEVSHHCQNTSLHRINTGNFLSIIDQPDDLAQNHRHLSLKAEVSAAQKNCSLQREFLIETSEPLPITIQSEFESRGQPCPEQSLSSPIIFS
jgi:hypothetical protein